VNKYCKYVSKIIGYAKKRKGKIISRVKVAPLSYALFDDGRNDGPLHVAKILEMTQKRTNKQNTDVSRAEHTDKMNTYNIFKMAREQNEDICIFKIEPASTI